jgi:ribosomal protein S7
MAPTFRQLASLTRGRQSKPYACSRSHRAFEGAPHRKGIIYKIATMSPRKPNSARRTIAKVRLVFSDRRVFAKIPGLGEHKLQSHARSFSCVATDPKILRVLTTILSADFMTSTLSRPMAASIADLNLGLNAMPSKSRIPRFISWEDGAVYSRWLHLFQQKIIGALTQRGLRAKAVRRFETALDLLKKRQRLSPSTILLSAFLRLSPEVQMKGGSRRPYVAPVSEHQRVSLAVRWLLKPLRDSQKRRNVSVRRFTDAVEEALLNRGPAVQQKKKIYRQALSTKHQKLPYKYR